MNSKALFCSLPGRYCSSATTAVACLMLAACANFPAIDGSNTPSTQGSQAGPTDGNAAKTQEDYIQAAVTALDAAALEDGLQRIAPLEQACWASARAEQSELLRQALTLYPAVALSPEQQASKDSYDALLLAMEENPSQALLKIGSIARPTRNRPLSDYWLAQARAYRSLDDGEAATLMLVRRESLLEPELLAENHQRIWNLQLESSRFLLSDPNVRYDAITQGWLSLGSIARQFWTDGEQVEIALNQWTMNFPGHPANLVYWPLARDLAYNTLHSAIRRVALLLPLTGRLAGPAVALRDGFVSAHFADSLTQLDIRVYDSANPSSAYDQAIADGAELIVGPLDKAQVETVIARNNNRLPMLALNYRDEAASQAMPAPTVLEYGLAPEDDARSAALKALGDGLTHAIALASDDDFGHRALSSFQQAFSAGGGVLLDSRFFTGQPKDYQTKITDLLKLKESKARFEAIQRLVGETLDTAPVRRQDAQFAYLAATPEQGRQIRPLMRYYHAEDLPIYSGGRIYAGRPDPAKDKDLNGVNFCAMPWLLGNSATWRERRRHISQAWPGRAQRYERFYAMGNDAYLLASTLRNGNWNQLPNIPGATGELSRQQQRIIRTLPCTRFHGGVPEIRETPEIRRDL